MLLCECKEGNKIASYSFKLVSWSRRVVCSLGYTLLTQPAAWQQSSPSCLVSVTLSVSVISLRSKCCYQMESVRVCVHDLTGLTTQSLDYNTPTTHAPQSGGRLQSGRQQSWRAQLLASLQTWQVKSRVHRCNKPQLSRLSTTPLVKRKRRSLMFVKMCIKPNSFKVSVLILVADDDEDDFPLRVTIK